MRELMLTRHNPMVDPAIHVWGWEIPVYLFLGGLVAGMMIVTGVVLLAGRVKAQRCVCSVLPLLGLVLLSAGMLALFLDLEHKAYVWRLYTAFEITSPMSWGAWILIAVYPALAAAFLVRPPELLRVLIGRLDEVALALEGRVGVVRAVGAVSVVLGVLLGVYTGVLLSALGARPLWNSALLGPLFLFSGVSAAAALTHLVARDPTERVLMAAVDTLVLVIELTLIGLFLVGLLSTSQMHIEAARLLLGGPYTAVFWVFVVGLGIIVPIVVQTLAVTHRIAHAPLAPVLVLAGGLILRFVIVYAGQHSHWVRL